MSESQLAILLASLALVGKIIEIILNSLVKKPAEKADAAAKIADVSMEVVDRIQQQVRDLEIKVAKLQTKVKKQDAILQKWMKGIEELIKQIKALGHVPCWTPEEFEVAELEDYSDNK